jgi:hypothetical protein
VWLGLVTGAVELCLQIFDPHQQRVQAEADEVRLQSVVEVWGRGGIAGLSTRPSDAMWL